MLWFYYDVVEKDNTLKKTEIVVRNYLWYTIAHSSLLKANRYVTCINTLYLLLRQKYECNTCFRHTCQVSIFSDLFNYELVIFVILLFILFLCCISVNPIISDWERHFWFIHNYSFQNEGFYSRIPYIWCKKKKLI